MIGRRVSTAATLSRRSLRAAGVVLTCGVVVLFALFAGDSGGDAQAAPPDPICCYSIEQGDLWREVTPLGGTGSVVTFYGYDTIYSASNAELGLQEPDTTLLLLYQDPGGQISLVIIHDEIDDPDGGQANVAISGLPAASAWVVWDDPPPNAYDVYTLTPPTATATWKWSPCCTDGGAIEIDLDCGFELTVDPEFITGIDTWQFLSGPSSQDFSRIELDMPDPPSAAESVTIRAQACQEPSFSLARGGSQVPDPIDPADLVVRSGPGTQPPTVARPCGPGGLELPNCGGLDEVDALSLGQDFTLPPPDPANPEARLFFSVGPGVGGGYGSVVEKETWGCLPESQPEGEADEFGSAAPGSNYQYLDGDGVASCDNPPARALGLVEPDGDDLDALDPVNPSEWSPPFFVSLDSASPSLAELTAVGGTGSGADIYVDRGNGIEGVYVTGAQLGLDSAGPNTDDIDALCIHDDGDGVYKWWLGDRIWLSLEQGSETLDFWTGPHPGDILTPRRDFQWPPGVYVVVHAGELGLLAGGDEGDDELDALKCYEGLLPPVGGIAELPRLDAEAVAGRSASSGIGMALVAGSTAAAIVAALMLGGAAWFARRRWVR